MESNDPFENYRERLARGQYLYKPEDTPDHVRAFFAAGAKIYKRSSRPEMVWYEWHFLENPVPFEDDFEQSHLPWDLDEWIGELTFSEADSFENWMKVVSTPFSDLSGPLNLKYIGRKHELWGDYRSLSKIGRVAQRPQKSGSHNIFYCNQDVKTCLQNTPGVEVEFLDVVLEMDGKLNSDYSLCRVLKQKCAVDVTKSAGEWSYWKDLGLYSFMTDPGRFGRRKAAFDEAKLADEALFYDPGIPGGNIVISRSLLSKLSQL